MSELKPCPFCGGEADPAGWMRGDGKTGPACDNCGGACESIEMWNTRAAPQGITAGEEKTIFCAELSKVLATRGL